MEIKIVSWRERFGSWVAYGIPPIPMMQTYDNEVQAIAIHPITATGHDRSEAIKNLQKKIQDFIYNNSNTYEFEESTIEVEV